MARPKRPKRPRAAAPPHQPRRRHGQAHWRGAGAGGDVAARGVQLLTAQRDPKVWGRTGWKSGKKEGKSIMKIIGKSYENMNHQTINQFHVHFLTNVHTCPSIPDWWPSVTSRLEQLCPRYAAILMELPDFCSSSDLTYTHFGEIAAVSSMGMQRQATCS